MNIQLARMTNARCPNFISTFRFFLSFSLFLPPIRSNVLHFPSFYEEETPEIAMNSLCNFFSFSFSFWMAFVSVCECEYLK